MNGWYPDWSGQTCFIVGGGPSVRDIDPEKLRGYRLIGVNEAGLTVVPWCDVLFWADDRWYRWNKDRLGLHYGPLKVHRHAGVVPGAHRVKSKLGGLSWAKDTVGGFDGGSSAINLALHFGAKKIVLVGFECRDLPMDRWRDGNFHDAHQEPPLVNQRAEKFVPAHQRIAGEIQARNFPVEILNATPDSALTCWRKTTLEQELAQRNG